MASFSHCFQMCILLGAVVAISAQTYMRGSSSDGLVHITGLPVFLGLVHRGHANRAKNFVDTAGTLRTIVRGLRHSLQATGGEHLTCIDLGAHEGFTGQSLIEGGCTELYAVEPGPKQFPKMKTRLSEVVKVYPEANVVFYQNAISSERGQVDFWDFPGHTSSNSLTSQDWHTGYAGSEVHRIQVKTVMISDVIPRDHGGIVDFIKVDIQGYELHGFSPLKQYLAAGGVHFVLFEFWPKGLRKAGYAGDSSPQKLLKLFLDSGFELHVVTNVHVQGGARYPGVQHFGKDMPVEGFVRRLEDVPDRTGFGSWVDILAIHRSPRLQPFSTEELETLLTPASAPQTLRGGGFLLHAARVDRPRAETPCLRDERSIIVDYFLHGNT